MLSNIKHGWCDFDIESEHHVISYISDAPVDMIKCFTNYYMYGAGIAYFDEEGSEFSLLLDLHGAKVITATDADGSFEESFKEVCFNCNVHELAQILYHDIADHFDEWINDFYLPVDSSEEQEYRKSLRNALTQLEVTLQWAKNHQYFVKQNEKQKEQKE